MALKLPPEHYFQSAAERMRPAQYLFQEGASFALAIYIGGVAVECLLRAFKGRRDPTFDEKHDLLRLFAASGMLHLDPDKLRARGWTDAQIDQHFRTLQVGVNEIFRLRTKRYRFASEDRLRSHLKEVTGYRKIKGDYLKEQPRHFLNSAQRFVDKGDAVARVRSPLVRRLQEALTERFPPACYGEARGPRWHYRSHHLHAVREDGDH